MRKKAIWVETVEAGWNVLAGCDHQHVVEAVRSARPGVEGIMPYGDGRAGKEL